MAFQAPESGGHRAAINVTPLIDILLVLLIVFLVAMPLLLRMMRVEVPPNVPNALVEDPPPIVVKVHADLTLAVDDDRGEHEIALADLAATVARQRVKAVFVDFDPGIPWSLAVSTLDTIRSVARDANHDEIRVLLRVHDD